ncbi:hypothetical protein EEL31_22480 [Brevibacillus laterosporus]|nr:hypothetical protein [Brevibacillus laterosporus]TPG70937.1 hypothetical protein EEL31_22480 [Brevibacillus laterosporus]
MSLDIGAIVAIAMAATSTLSSWLGIPTKLRAWTTLGFILLLKIGYDWLYGPVPFIWKDSLMHGITAGLAAVGIYSTTKNTQQHMRSITFQSSVQSLEQEQSSTQIPVPSQTQSQAHTQQTAIEIALNQSLSPPTATPSAPNTDPEQLPPTTDTPTSEAPLESPSQLPNDSSQKKNFSSYEDYV